MRTNTKLQAKLAECGITVCFEACAQVAGVDLDLVQVALHRGAESQKFKFFKTVKRLDLQKIFQILYRESEASSQSYESFCLDAGLPMHSRQATHTYLMSVGTKIALSKIFSEKELLELKSQIFE